MGFDTLLTAIEQLFAGGSIVYVGLGIVLGLCFGGMPGLGGTTALALLIPITYSMQALDAMYLAGGVMGAVTFGGSLSAILLNTPGTAPNAATTFDGFPLAQQGKAGMAIGASATASALGGVFGLFTLLLILPVAKQVVLMFGPAEFFLLTILGLTAIALAVRGKLLRGLIAGCLGLMVAFVGTDPISGDERFTFGLRYLWDGVPLVPTLTGMFAISQMIELALKGGSISAAQGGGRQIHGVWAGVRSVFENWTVLIRGSIIGTVIGLIPGLGGVVASFLAYTSTAQTARDSETFGKGNIKGVIAPESANNAKDGGALVPTVAFGIPGSAEMAVFLAILVLQGIDPGPSILLYHEDQVYGLIVALTASAIGASIIGILLSRWLINITFINVQILVPMVIAVSLTGVYSLNGDPSDMITCLVMGVLGYLMIRFDYPRLTFVIAMVLGSTAEASYHQVQLISDHNALGFMLGRPASVALILAIAFTLALPVLRELLGGRMGGKRKVATNE